MRTIAATLARRDILKNIFIDSVALAVIYFTPAIAHLIALPVYMIEPMRLMLILSMAHSTRNNSYLLALTLPLFSFITTSHPEFLKMLIITAELTLNVFLFYWLFSRFRNAFISMVSAVILSKIACYGLYLIFFSLAFVRSEAGLSFLAAQAITTVLFSAYVYFIQRRKIRD